MYIVSLFISINMLRRKLIRFNSMILIINISYLALFPRIIQGDMSHIILSTGQKSDMAHIDFPQAIVSINDRAGLKLICILIIILFFVLTNDRPTLNY